LEAVNGSVGDVGAFAGGRNEGRVFCIDDSDNVAQVFTLTCHWENGSSSHDGWFFLFLG
jgi:hypothetical protein